MTKMYKCPHCSDDVEIWCDLKTNEMKSYVDDWFETSIRYCIMCNEGLDDSPDKYIVDV